MAGMMRKAGLYLGLVEDEDERYDGRARDDWDGYDDEDDLDADAATSRRAPRGGRLREAAPTEALPVRRGEVRGSSALDTALRTAPAPSAVHEDPYRITTLHPRTYNEARTIGEHFRDGTPVIMNLTEMDDTDAKRLVDFAAGLSFGLRGRIERVTAKVFLLSPEHVEVTAEDKARMAVSGFFYPS